MPLMRRLCAFLSFLGLLGLLALFAGCDQQAMFDKLVPQEEAAIGKQVVAQLAARDYAGLQKQLDPGIKDASTQTTLEQMAAMFPPGAPKSLNTVGAHIVAAHGVTRYNLTFEHEFETAWLLSHVVLQKRDKQITVLGLHVNVNKQSLKALNRFTFAGKGVLHYMVFALAIAIPLLIVFTLILCARTPIARRKWLWMLFVAVGFVQFSLNWTDGSYSIQPISFLVLGAAFLKSGPYAPVILSVAFPLGAVAFLLRRRALAAAYAASKAHRHAAASHASQSLP